MTAQATQAQQSLMHPSDEDQIQTFIQAVVVPAFSDIQTLLDLPVRRITIAYSADTGNLAVDSLLRQMHGDTPYLSAPSNPTSSQAPSSQNQSWICGSLVIELLQHPEPDSICIGQYGLSIQIKINASAQIEVCSIIGFATPLTQEIEIQAFLFEANHQPLDIEAIDSADITLQFAEHCKTFETQILEPETIPEEIPEISPPLNAFPPLPEASPPASAMPISAPIPEAPSIFQPPISESTFAEIATEIDNLQAVQRQATETLLSYLKLTQRSFRHLWKPDFERASALAQKIVNHRPEQNSDYQQAYDLLSQQATEFAWSLKPNMLSEFADYFELYWSMADSASIFTASQENRPYPETFITQVHALGEPENLAQVKTDISNALRSLVRSIGLKFGRPDERGNRDWIGFGSMHSTEPVEQMPRKIQTLNDQRRVLFETLSWGILQVYQNVDDLPPIEQKLGRNPVISYLISARLTIQKPTHAVESNTRNIEDYEFRFNRLIEDGSHSWMATARVQVSRGRTVNLYGYEIEAC